MKCVKRADLPPEDEADLKMEVKLLQEVRNGPSWLAFRCYFTMDDDREYHPAELALLGFKMYGA